MKLEISNRSRSNNEKRTAMSQQSLVNSLLDEKQAVQPVAQPQNIQQVQPVQNWGGK